MPQTQKYSNTFYYTKKFYNFYIEWYQANQKMLVTEKVTDGQTGIKKNKKKTGSGSDHQDNRVWNPSNSDQIA